MRINYIIIVAILFAGKLIFPQADANKAALLMQDENYFAGTKDEKKIIEQITAWELLFLDNKIGYDVITPDDIDVSLNEKYSAMIIATDIILEMDQFNSLKEYSENRGRIFISGTISVDDDGKIISNNEVILKLTGINISRLNSNELKNVKQIFTGTNQLTSEINYKSCLLLSTSQEFYYTNVSGSTSKAIGYIDLDGKQVEQAKTSIVYGYNINTKFIWCGFDMTDLIGGESEKQLFAKFVLNSLNWLNGITYSQIRNTKLSRIPFLFSPILNGRIDQTDKVIRLISDFNLKPYFLITESAVNDSALLNEFSDLGEFGLKIDDMNKTTADLNRLINTLEKNVSRKIKYISASDINRVIKYREELVNAGINVVFLYSNSETYIPFFIDNMKELLIIPETYFYKINQNEISSLQVLAEAVNDQYNESVINIGFDPVLCESEDEKKLRRFLSDLFDRSNPRQTIHTGYDLNSLYNWFQVKDELTSNVRLDRNGNLELELGNRNDIKVEDLFFILTTDELKTEPVLYENNQISTLNFTFDKNKKELKIFIEELKSYETKRIRIVLNSNL